MKCLLQRLWNDDDGAVLSSELMLYGTVGVLGATTGYAALRDAVNSELDDVSKAIGSVDQSYGYAGVQGHSAFTAGSAFYDRADYCDVPPVYAPLPCPPVDRPLVCADVFGPNARPGLAAELNDRRPTPPGPGPRDARPRDDDDRREPARDRDDDDDDDDRRERSRPAVVPHAVPGPSKGVHIGHPGFGPQPFVEPYLVDVPEGFFSRPPTGYIGPVSQYQNYLHSRVGMVQLGSGHGPAFAPGAAMITPPGVIVQPHVVAPVHVDRGPPQWNTIDLGFTKVGDEELKQVEKFKDAKCLHVVGSNVTNKGLEYIAELEQLESLHLVATKITDAGLEELRELPRLRFLHIVGTPITDAGLVHLRGLKHLEELELRSTHVTERGLAELRQSLPTLRVIR